MISSVHALLGLLLLVGARPAPGQAGWFALESSETRESDIADIAESTEDVEAEEETSAGKAFRTFGKDLRHLLTFPARPTRRGVLTATAVLGGTGLLVLYDDEIREESQQRRSPTLDEWESRIEPFGSVEVTFGGALSVYAVGRVASRPELTETGRTLVEALLLTEVLSKLGKGLTARSHPTGDARADEFFEEFPGVFPSGHTARAFAVTAVVAQRYGRTAGWIGYPLATLVGLARIESDEHWASDVLAGGALGWAVGRTVARRRAERRSERRLSVVPTFSVSGRRQIALVRLRF